MALSIVMTALIRKSLPDCSMGLTLGFNYKNFDVSAFFKGVFGNEVYNLTNYLGEFNNQTI